MCPSALIAHVSPAAALAEQRVSHARPAGPLAAVLGPDSGGRSSEAAPPPPLRHRRLLLRRRRRRGLHVAPPQALAPPALRHLHTNKAI